MGKEYESSVFISDYSSCGTTSRIEGDDIILQNIVTLRPIGSKTVKAHLVGEEYGSYTVECIIPRRFNMSTNMMNVTIQDYLSAKTSKNHFELSF